MQRGNLKKLKLQEDAIRLRENLLRCGLFTLIGVFLVGLATAICVVYLMYWVFLPIQSDLALTLSNTADVTSRANAKSYAWFDALDNAARLVNALNGTNLDQLVENVRTAAETVANINVDETVEHITQISASIEKIAHNLADKKKLELEIGGFSVAVPIDDPTSVTVNH